VSPVDRFARRLPTAGPGLGALPPRPVPSRRLVPVAPPRAGRVGGAIPAAAAPAEIELRLLVVAATGDEPSFTAAAGALARIGVPFTTLIATQEPLDHASLWTETGGCRYAGIVLAQSEVGYEDAVTGWSSALDADEWQRLDDYELACAARERLVRLAGREQRPEFVSSSRRRGGSDLSTAGAPLFDTRAEPPSIWPASGATAPRSSTQPPPRCCCRARAAGAGGHHTPDAAGLADHRLCQWTRHARRSVRRDDWVQPRPVPGRAPHLQPPDDVFIDTTPGRAARPLPAGARRRRLRR
jgi:hypothetical protein